MTSYEWTSVNGERNTEIFTLKMNVWGQQRIVKCTALGISMAID